MKPRKNGCATWRRLRPWKDADLKVIREGELPKAQIFNAFFLYNAEDNNEKILRLIKGRKRTMHEQLENPKGYRSSTESANTAHVILLIDDQSIKKLKTCGYKVSFKLGEVTIRLKDNKPKTSSGGQSKGKSETVGTTASKNRTEPP